MKTYHAECATSPCQKDQRSKRIAPHVHVKAQALIIMSDLRAIYSAHLRKYPQDAGRVSFSGFKTLKPWYAIKGDRETCLCKWCENFKCYQEALRVCASYIEPLLSSNEEGAAEGDNVASDSIENADPTAERPAGAADPAAAANPANPASSATDPASLQLQKLVHIAGLRSKQDIVNEFVCGRSIGTAKYECVLGSCAQCGFRNLWSKGLRASIVDDQGNLCAGVDKAWLTKIKYERLRSSSKPPSNAISGEPSTAAGTGQVADKELMRQRCESTIIEVLDEFEAKVMAKYPYHRKTLANQKLADQQASVVLVSA